MKKFLGIFTGILFLVILAGCQAKTSAIVSFVNDEQFLTSIIFSIEINDPDGEITGAVSVNLLNNEGSIVQSQLMTEEANYIDITFPRLDSGVKYTVEVIATVGRNSIVLGTIDYTTLSASTIHITTTEEFLNMGANRSGNYVLDNDLDFTDVDFASPFTLAFSGNFDGQGHTISNVTFSSITRYTGIFGYVSSGIIKDLNIENVTIGTEASPLSSTLYKSYVGILAGSVSISTAVIENISITNSEINYTSSSSELAYVGAVVGESRGSISGLTVDDVSMNITSTSYGKIKIGGAIGLLNEDAKFKEANVNVDIHFTLAGTALKNREVLINIGGVIGDHNARNNVKSVENIASMSNVTVDLDYGTTADTTNGSYVAYVGGIAGFAMSNVVNSFYGGSITLNHEKNANETNVSKAMGVGGLFGFYGSNKALQQVVRLGNGQTIDINVSDDVALKASQTLGDKVSTASHTIGIFGDTNLNINLVSMVASDTSVVYTDLTDYFTSDWIKDAFDAVNIPG